MLIERHEMVDLLSKVRDHLRIATSPDRDALDQHACAALSNEVEAFLTRLEDDTSLVTNG